MQSCKENQLVSGENSTVEFVIGTTLGDRIEQEDGFGYVSNPTEALIVVCDGMGGLEGGKLASSIAVKTMLTNYEHNYPFENITDFLLKATKEANKNVYGLQINDHETNAGSTIVSVVISENKLYWASVGDSRAYLYRKESFVQFTQDHNYKTVLESKINTGAISENEFNREIEKGEALICHLGLPELDLIDFNDLPIGLEHNDIIAIMSDGLYKVLYDDEIFTIISNFGNIVEAVKALELKAKKMARDKEISRDNTTIAIIKVK